MARRRPVTRAVPVWYALLRGIITPCEQALAEEGLECVKLEAEHGVKIRTVDLGIVHWRIRVPCARLTRKPRALSPSDSVVVQSNNATEPQVDHSKALESAGAFGDVWRNCRSVAATTRTPHRAAL
jgi:hypothetical protein